jgi:hypothetical protein
LTKEEEEESCWEYFIDGTARRLLFGRTTLRKLVIVSDIVGFRVGIFGKDEGRSLWREGYSI